MIRASDILGCVVRTETGDRIGRVHDLRALPDAKGWRLCGIVVGPAGMLARLNGAKPNPASAHDVIPWEAITRLEEGIVTVRDRAAAAEPPLD